MRDIYNLRSKYPSITQGSVITGCLANGYNSCEVFGCVITARCDLARPKVSTVHYLPIVPYENWLRKEIEGLIREEYAKDVKGRMAKQLRDGNLEPGLIDRKLSRADIEIVVESRFKSKEVKNFMENYDRWINSSDIAMKNLLNERTGEKILEQEVKLMVGHGNSNFYLIEDWRSKPDRIRFMVLLLRDIKTITWDCAQALPNGILEDEQEEAFFEDNMLSRSEDKDQMYYVDTEVKSPYIEHILQRFTNNFSRIGLVDLPNADVKSLIEQSKSILQ